MNISSDDLDSDTRAALILEYTTLREEILKRVEFRQQYLSITLTITAVFLGVGLSTPIVAFVLPPIITLLASAWLQNEFRINQAAAFIREKHEKRILGLSWETVLSKERRERRNKPLRERAWRSLSISTQVFFIAVQFVAMGIGLLGVSVSSPSDTELILLGVDVLSMLLVRWLFKQSATLRHQFDNQETS